MGSGSSFRLAGESAQMRPRTAKAAVPGGDPGRQGATRTLLSGPKAIHTWLGYAPCWYHSTVHATWACWCSFCPLIFPSKEVK